ncbi:MAG TPA: hypothetical protein PLY70_00525 [Saprospiraceae bacterium]|nr:hypothetical protein [Saprospiraceae bacterium]HPN69034.1 hypothetical protein [Saprospiraceae bacterium]
MNSTASNIVNTTKANFSLEAQIVFWLRFAISGCFIGHGMWGFAQKPAWIPFFNTFGISDEIAQSLMPLIGSVDIFIGIAILLSVNKFLILWAIIWTLFTALLRPLAGMSFGEFFERAGNFGPPIALYLLLGYVTFGQQKKININTNVLWVLRSCLSLLLIGHGWLAIEKHSTIAANLSFLNFPTDGSSMIYFGLFEVSLGLLVFLLHSSNLFLWTVLALKLSTEFIYPLRGQMYDIFETIERMGDYLLPFILILINTHKRNHF